jgi:hypothetical protein
VEIKNALSMIKKHVPLPKDTPIMEAWQTLEEYCTQPTDVQQLQAKIAALITKVDTFPRYNIPGPVSEFIEAVRQLSA